METKIKVYVIKWMNMEKWMKKPRDLGNSCSIETGFPKRGKSE
jgi:hypothetical protein